MSKNSAIEIILRVRPHKNTFKGFSTSLIIKPSTRSKVVLNFSSPKMRKKDILITNNKNDPFSLIRFSIWTPNKKKSSTK